ncbi:MAG TPA: PEP-CTERM sorting domain-containing protein [Verrucomicrobiae bacterium]|nr:PEP-CTERM sorting domain-containing protein [Verrucomicrobiae bacterium]
MNRTLLATAFAGVILLSMQVTQAQSPIYREVFGNITGTGSSNASPSSVGWAGNWGATASDASVGDAPAGTFNNFGVSTALGSPNNLGNINAGLELSQANGLMFVSQAGQNFIAYTTGYTVNQTLTPIQDISFYAGSTFDTAGGIPGFRIAVQQDGNWYASTAVLANSLNVTSAGNFHLAPGSGGAQQVTFNWTTAASAWNNLTFVAGTSLALGGISGGLNGDPITAFGLYSDATDSLGNTENAIRRFDTYQIDTVPEPGSVVLGLFGVGLLMMSLRRSRTA